MKTKKISFLLLSLSLFFSLFITSCDVKSPVDGVELRVKTLARTTVASLSIYDAGSKNLIKPDNVTVTFEGKDGSKVISMTNEPITTLSTTNGIINFAISENVIPTPETPVEVTVIVTAPNYVSSSVQLFITSPGASAYSINLANITSPPTGVVSDETKGTADNSGATEDIVATSGEETNTGASATITIPKGTILKDKNGNTLSGEVVTRVTYFNPLDEQSLTSFPGGFSVNTGSERGSFVTAGFTAIDMTVGGVKVEQFGSDVNVDIDIPTNLVNPETGTTVTPGDKIPLWSYNEDTGEWTKEGEVTVPTVLAKATSGKSVYKVSTQIKHLSYWNLDWFQDACYEGIAINITGGCFPYLEIKAKRADGNSAYFYSGWVNGSDRIVHLYNAPRAVPVIVELWDYSVYPEKRVAQMQIDDLCGTDVDLPITETNGMVEVTATATAVCHNSDGTVKSRFYPDNYPIYVRHPNNSNWSYIGQVIDGEISACLELGVTYTFATFIDGSWVEYPFTINQTNFDIEFSDLEYPNEMRDFCN